MSQKHFIKRIIEEDNKTGKYGKRVHTRFPPEPNGYLHIGHAKAVCLNFNLAKEYNGICNLRFDDTNPTKEENKYVEAIKRDIKWLGYDWEDRLYFASDYFEKMYQYAVQLVKEGKAYVDDLDETEIREYRGTVKTPGKNSPYRNRSIEENLNLLEKMKNGEFEEGHCVLRAKIDMAHPNMLMRDPLIYRIRHKKHHRTGDKWHIYPMYDYAHCLEDSIERITHSLCTLEFENNRALYDWFLEAIGTYRPQQIEFARLNLSHTIMSKRKLEKLVSNNFVDGWDDPRLPTLAGLKRRGYTPEAIKSFIDSVGVAKADNLIEMSLLEYHIRQNLNKTSSRVMGVLKPLKVVITNYPENKTEILEMINNPEDKAAGTREVPFSRELYIERSDFMKNPPKKFWRLGPGREVRLRWAYFIKCEDFVIDKETGEVKEIHCTYDPETKGGSAPDGRKVKATLHWVSAKHALDAEVRLYEHLLEISSLSEVEKGKDFTDYLNSESLQILNNCKVEPGLKNVEPLERFQFERVGYFCVDKDSTRDKLIFNRTVTMRDQWKKILKKQRNNKKYK